MRSVHGIERLKIRFKKSKKTERKNIYRDLMNQNLKNLCEKRNNETMTGLYDFSFFLIIRRTLKKWNQRIVDR